MVQKPTTQNASQEKQPVEETTAIQSDQKQTRQAVTGIQPRYPQWPTSRPGPRKTPPPPGTRPINSYRSEQVTPIESSQETDMMSAEYRSQTSTDLTGSAAPEQKETAQEELKRRKHRIE